MNLQDVPVLFDLLNSEDLKPISTHSEGDKIICEDKDGKMYFLKDCNGIEGYMFKTIFPRIKHQKLHFTRLVLPDFKKIVTTYIQEDNTYQEKKLIFLNYYDGITFNNKWDETKPEGYGGRGISISMADKVIELLKDFSMIDLDSSLTFKLSKFNFSKWKKNNFLLLSTSLIQQGFLTPDHVKKARAILFSSKLFKNSSIILTNGDLYPRNFIELANNKIVVVDWEGRRKELIFLNGKYQYFESQRNAFINYLENHAAFFFIHMWGNYLVQKKFMKKLSQKLHLNALNIQAAILIKSLEQAVAFKGGPLTYRQTEIFVNALDIQFINDFLR